MKRTCITSRLLLVLHQKPLPQSRISTSAAVPSIRLGFAALFSGNLKTTPGTGKSILQVSARLVSTSTASRVADWPTEACTCYDRGKKETGGDRAGLIDYYFVDFASDHHYYRQLGHISDQAVTFRRVASYASYLCRRAGVNIYTPSWVYMTTLVRPICPIRTFTSFSPSLKADNMMSTDIRAANNNNNMYSDISDKEIADGNIQAMRQEYRNDADTFDIKDLVSRDPLIQFGSWFQQAHKDPEVKEPNAIALATASRSGQPSVRMVSLKGFGKDGFKIFTNFDSRKGKELMENPFCSLCIFWQPLERSVRIEGKVTPLPVEESSSYFNSRPRCSQLGAIVSNQSTIIPNREFLMDKYAKLAEKYGSDQVIPKPDFWGGYLIKPDVIEFWQGQTNRIHDRIRFRKMEPDEVLDPELTHEGENGWVIERLSP